MNPAVVLMAYGSPERLADVAAYYADIRGGRPIAPKQLDDLIDRYRLLGVEEHNPLNAITEKTRVALGRELGLAVCAGMKHWTPHIADAVRAEVLEVVEDVRPEPRLARRGRALVGERPFAERCALGDSAARFSELLLIGIAFLHDPCGQRVCREHDMP
jgi:hypothetical protein